MFFIKNHILYVLLFLLLFHLASVDGAINIYVSPDGNDMNIGSVEQPFASIPRAQQAVRDVKAQGLTSDVIVYLREGTYYLDEILQFLPLDGGTDEYRVKYISYPGELAVISGGQEISGWISAGTDLWKTYLPEVSSGQWWFRQLWCNGQRCIRARWPNKDQYLEITDVSEDNKTITLDQSVIGAGPALNDTEIVTLFYWGSGRARLLSSFGNSVTTLGVCGSDSYYTYEPTVGEPVFFEHNYDYIDQEKEWFLDSNEGWLYYKSEPNVNPNNDIFIAPKLKNIMLIQGRSVDPVKNLFFEGISFEHTGWDYDEYGYTDTGAKNIFIVSDVNGNYLGRKVLTPVIGVFYANGCQFKRCQIAHVATVGLGFGKGCEDCQITDSHVYDTGGSGIITGWFGSDIEDCTVVGLDETLRPSPINTIVGNNFIHDCGAEWFGCAGISENYCRQTSLINNDISNMPASGIACGFTQTDNEPYVQQECFVENNHIYNVMNMLHDGGGIYTIGNHRGAVLSGNLIHSLGWGWRTGFQWQNNAIFLDNNSSNIHLNNNIAYDIPDPDYGIRITANVDLNTITFVDNYWNLDPVDWLAAQTQIAGQAGVHPNTPQIEVNLVDADYIVTGSCESWAQIHSAFIEENNQDVSGYLLIKENGAITGSIPKSALSPDALTLSLVVSDPGGELSSEASSFLRMPADISLDNKVNMVDFAILASYWNYKYNCNPNLIGYWNFNELSGAIVYDGTSYQNDGIFGGDPTRVSDGWVNSAIHFDGSGDYINFGTFNPSASTGAFTFSIWAYWDGTNAAYQVLAAKRESYVADEMMWQIAAAPDTNEFSVTCSGTPSVSFGPISSGGWVHFAFTYDGSDLILYLNGNKVQEQPFTMGTGTNSPFIVGASTSTGSTSFLGKLDDLRVFDRVLDNSEILQIYQDNSDMGNSNDINLRLSDINSDSKIDLLDLAFLTINWLN